MTRPGIEPRSPRSTKNHHYPLPIPEEIFNKFNGGKIFSKIDSNLQIEVEEIFKQLFCLYRKKPLGRDHYLPFDGLFQILY